MKLVDKLSDLEGVELLGAVLGVEGSEACSSCVPSSLAVVLEWAEFEVDFCGPFSLDVVDGGRRRAQRPVREIEPERVGRGAERNLVPGEARAPHIDPHQTVPGTLGPERPGDGLDGHALPARLLEQQRSDGARAIAAGLDLAAIGVADFHEHIAAPGRRAHHHELVAADAGAPVRQPAIVVVRPADRPVARIQHDEIVAKPVHLDEGNAHLSPRRRLRRIQRLSRPGAPARQWRAVVRFARSGPRRSHQQRHAVMAGVGAAVEAAVRQEADAVHGGEAEGERAADHLIAHRRQRLHDIARNAVRDVDGVRGGGEARRRHRLGHGHAMVQHVQDRLRHAHGDLRAARRAQRQTRPLALEDDGRAERGEAALAGRDRPRPAGTRIEHAHAAVIHEAQPRRDDAGRHAERMRHGDDAALAVDRHHMGGVRRLRREALDRGALAALDLGGQRAAVFPGDQPVERHVVEGRVADMGVLVARRALHRLADDAQIVGAVVADRRQIEMLQLVQHLQHLHAAAGRAVGRHPPAAIVGADRLGRRRAIGGEVGGGHQPAIGAHVGVDLLGDLAGVEDVGPAPGDALQRARHVGIDDALADALQASVLVEIDRPPGFGEGVALAVGGAAHLLRLPPPEIDMRAHDEALAGPGDRRRADIRPVPAAEALDGLVKGLERARRGDRAVADIVDPALQDEAEAVARLALDQMLPHGRIGGQRRLAMEVDAAMRARRRQIEMAGAEAGDAAHLRIDHALHQGGGDGGVDGVAAPLQHARAGFGGLRLGGDDHGGAGHGVLSCRELERNPRAEFAARARMMIAPAASTPGVGASPTPSQTQKEPSTVSSRISSPTSAAGR